MAQLCRREGRTRCQVVRPVSYIPSYRMSPAVEFGHGALPIAAPSSV